MTHRPFLYQYQPNVQNLYANVIQVVHATICFQLHSITHQTCNLHQLNFIHCPPTQDHYANCRLVLLTQPHQYTLKTLMVEQVPPIPTIYLHTCPHTQTHNYIKIFTQSTQNTICKVILYFTKIHFRHHQHLQDAWQPNPQSHFTSASFCQIKATQMT